ncbi:preprotein translocase subunit SecG [Thiovibrio sp. JS02]
METLLTVIHIIVCLFLIVIVLLQHGKGANMGAAFGGASQTVFGTDGPVPLLNKITTGAAIIFMLTSILLAYYSTNMGDGSVMKEVTPAAGEQKSAPAPAIPLPPAANDVPLGEQQQAPAKSE